MVITQLNLGQFSKSHPFLESSFTELQDPCIGSWIWLRLRVDMKGFMRVMRALSYFNHGCTIELIMTIMMAPLHTLYNIIVVSKVQCLILIHFKTIITPWMIFPPDYKYLYIGRTAGHTVCHRLVTQSSSKWTLPVAGVGAVVIMLRILFKF